MTPQDLATIVEQYHAGIEAELRLLRQLEALAARQRDVTVAGDFDAFHGPSAERDRVTQNLVTIEEDLRALRKILVANREAAERAPGFNRAVGLHREAGDLVARILSTDRVALRALADADVARRAALSGLEQGEATLAAYRKVLTPAGGASLVNGRG